MHALYNVVMYALSFGLMAVIVGTVLGLAFWLLRAAWRILTKLR
jgi:hypothetical protein